MNKIKNLLFSSALCSIALSSNAADIETNTARFQAMNKITGQVKEIDVSVNGLANFETFSILVRKCVTKSPEETPENTAFVDVVDDYQTSTPTNIFKGWMFSSTPGINGVEHPIYDIWLLKCFNSNKKTPTLSQEQLSLRDEIPMKRHEKIEQTISLSLSETNNTVSESAPMEVEVEEAAVAQNNNEKTEENIIQLSISEKSSETSSPTDAVSEEAFISEGEEPETIFIPEDISSQEKSENETDE